MAVNVETSVITIHVEVLPGVASSPGLVGFVRNIVKAPFRITINDKSTPSG